MKKLLSVLILVMIFAGSAFADGHRVGILSHINSTEEEFKTFVDDLHAHGFVRAFSTEQKEAPTFVFYDSLIAMIMGLNAKEIDEMFLPEAVGEYMMNTIDRYVETCVIRALPVSFAFGFRKSDDPDLRNKFNETLMSMKADGSLQTLVAKYIYEPGVDEPEPVKFEKFENVDKVVRVAVTGDLPPVDLIKADGTPAGFNTAVLAEIARRLKINVELVSIEAGARSASLASGRSDIVFWFQCYNAATSQPDIPEAIVLSEPYYTFSEFLHIAVK